MPVLTKQDLEDWNAHPVTKMIFKEIKQAQVDLAMISPVCDTCDETAMKAAYHKGVLEGSNSLIEYYEIMMFEDKE
jgi:hypothetical protein